MLHEFSVENFLSFKKEQVLSFEATSDKTYDDFYVIDKGNIKLLKMALIYGANASGKTNLLKAIDFLRDAVLQVKEDKTEGTACVPFLLSQGQKGKPSKFSLSFYINTIRYVYDLSMTTSRIASEKLIYYPRTQPALLFERNYIENGSLSKISFGEKIGLSNRERIILEGNTINNQTVLASYLVSNVYSQTIDKVVNWFQNDLFKLITPETKLSDWTSSRIVVDEKKRQFSVEALKFADFNIADIKVNSKSEKIPQDLLKFMRDQKGVSEEDIQQLLSDNSTEIEIKEVIFQHKTDRGKYSLPFSAQSQGTKRYYGLTGPLLELQSDNKVVLIDDVESSLHYELVNTFLRTFLANSGASQIICTTHNIQLLDEDYMRRDIVWFCEKEEAGSSDLFPLKAFRLHKNLSVLNAYKTGKLGAKPEPNHIYF